MLRRLGLENLTNQCKKSRVYLLIVDCMNNRQLDMLPTKGWSFTFKIIFEYFLFLEHQNNDFTSLRKQPRLNS